MREVLRSDDRLRQDKGLPNLPWVPEKKKEGESSKADSGRKDSRKSHDRRSSSARKSSVDRKKESKKSPDKDRKEVRNCVIQKVPAGIHVLV